MKKFINKIILTSSAIIFAGIVGYGIVYAQQVCCSTILDACISTFNRTSAGYNIDISHGVSPPHNLSNQLQSNLCSKNILADFDSGNACCESDRCGGYNQATEFSLSFTQDFHPLQKSISSFDAAKGAQTTFEPYNLSTPHKAEPIYILTKSIIC